MEKFDNQGWVVVYSNAQENGASYILLSQENIKTCMLSSCYGSYGQLIELNYNYSPEQYECIEDIKQEISEHEKTIVRLQKIAGNLYPDEKEKTLKKIIELESVIEQKESQLYDIEQNPEINNDEEVQAFTYYDGRNWQSIIFKFADSYRDSEWKILEEDDEEAQEIINDFLESEFYSSSNFKQINRGKIYDFTTSSWVGAWGIDVDKIKECDN